MDDAPNQVTPMTRVVLLARAGAACERLREALERAGADLVLTADPTVCTQEEVSAVAPQAVLVALDPSVEDVLDRFGAIFADPNITVIFDEAELAAQRAGWDSARWVRHLTAKLHRHEDVLPPGTEEEQMWYPLPGGLGQEMTLQGAQDSPPPLTELEIASLSDEAQQLAEAVPIEGALREEPALAEQFNFQDTDSVLSLVDISVDDPVHQRAKDAANAGFARDLEELHLRAASIELVTAREPGEPDQRRGAVLIEAGLGGPDAVRQLLGDLPDNFPRAVLVRLRLDGGRYDRLVRQMERVARLPVSLAESGRAIEPGHVYFLPPELGLVEEGLALVFSDTVSSATLISALLPGDSAILFLSGSDPALIDNAMNSHGNGALVAAQNPETCYDGTASSEVIARGGIFGAPTELARQLKLRWPK